MQWMQHLPHRHASTELESHEDLRPQSLSSSVALAQTPTGTTEAPEDEGVVLRQDRLRVALVLP